MNPVHFSSERETWNTPEAVLIPVRQIAPIGLDPCSNEGSIVGAAVAWELERDGDSLLRPWDGHGLVFVNPPYGRSLGPWAEKVAQESKVGVEMAVLVPARPGSEWWRALCDARPVLCCLHQRVTFLGAVSGAPFPSAIFYFGPRRERFAQVFGDLGTISEPRIEPSNPQGCIDGEGHVRTHPAADLFPLLPDVGLRALAEDIKANGQHEPIVLFEGAILDGRNRWRACEIAGVKPKTVEWFGGNPWDFVWSLNAERRHLEPGQKVAIRLKFLRASEGWKADQEEKKKRAEEARRGALRGNQNAAPSAARVSRHTDDAVSTDTASSVSPSTRTPAKTAPRPEPNRERAEVAKAARVSPATAARAIELEKKDPALFEKVVAGETTLGKALATVKHEEARARVAAQAKAAPVRAIVRKRAASDFLAALEPASIDLLLTDPPYMTDVEDIGAFAASWVPLALSRVKDSGRAYICTGAYPLELQAYLAVLLAESRLNLANLLVWTYRNTLGPSPKLDYKLNWQAIFYLRGKDAPPLDCPVMLEQFSVQDINAPDGRQGDRYHAWQKPDELADRLVRHSSQAGQLVVDPFAGTGTFLLAAARIGRRAIGCDISEESLRIAEERGCQRAK